MLAFSFLSGWDRNANKILAGTPAVKERHWQYFWEL
jgi:hypothetical protein